jgi:type 1 fimbria pilin
MKKFKSLMLAALASAALAAPSFAGGHGSNLVMTGEVVVKAKMTSVTPDGGDTTTVQDIEIGDVNA